MNIAAWLQATASRVPSRPAIYSGKVCHADYATLRQRVRQIAAALQQDYGIGTGDRVAIFMPNHPDYLTILYAVWWLGAVVVPVNYKLHANEAAWIIDNAGASLVFTDANRLPDTAFAVADAQQSACRILTVGSTAWKALLTFSETLANESPMARLDNDLAWIFYTSGTTGRPKGAMLSHGNLVAMSLAYCMDVDHADPDYHMLYAAPMSHGAGLYHPIFIRCGAAHIVPASQGFQVAEIEQLAKHFDRLVFFAAPTMVKRLIAHAVTVKWHGEGIRSIIYGGGPMYAADIEAALQQFGARFIQIYGQGETPMTITALRRETIADKHHPNCVARRVSVGQVMSGMQIRLVDEQGQAVAATNTAGEIWVKGPTVMQGYWQDSKTSAETLTTDGWLKTGDIGRLDADGFLTLTDRSKDVIISGGSNIYPREVEEVLAQHPDVIEVGVVGQNDDEWGEVVVAFVVLREGATVANDDLDKWCQSLMASFKKPKHYRFCDALPKNNYGKILKVTLREWL